MLSWPFLIFSTTPFLALDGCVSTQVWLPLRPCRSEVGRIAKLVRPSSFMREVKTAISVLMEESV